MAKLLRKLTKLNTQKIDGGIKLTVESSERTYGLTFGLQKSEMEIPKDASSVTHPECYCKKVHQKEVNKITFDVFKMEALDGLIIRRKFGSSSKEYRTYTWTGRTLHMTRSTLADDRPMLTHEQCVDIARHLIHV